MDYEYRMLWHRQAIDYPKGMPLAWTIDHGLFKNLLEL